MDFNKTMDKAIKMCDNNSKSYTVYKGYVWAEKFGTVGNFSQALKAAESLSKKLNKNIVIQESVTGKAWLVKPDGSSTWNF